MSGVTTDKRNERAVVQADARLPQGLEGFEDCTPLISQLHSNHGQTESPLILSVNLPPNVSDEPSHSPFTVAAMFLFLLRLFASSVVLFKKNRGRKKRKTLWKW